MISTARLRGCKRLFYQRFGWLMMNAMNQTQPLRRQNTQSEKTHSQPSLKAGQQWNQADTAEFMHTSYSTLAVKPFPSKRSASPSGYNSSQSECSAAWQRTCFGSRGSKVRILVLRPSFLFLRAPSESPSNTDFATVRDDAFVSPGIIGCCAGLQIRQPNFNVLIN